MNQQELIKARFWCNVSRTNNQECWLWEGDTSGGYSRFTVRKGEQWIGSRFAWTLINGEIPEGLCVCHKCDNPRCVNPFHLFLGTKSDNNLDCVSKGRNFIPLPKKVCKNGHPMTDDNVVIWKCNTSKSGVVRVCRKCRKAYEKKYTEQRAALSLANQVKI